MKAYVLENVGDISLKDVDKPMPKEGEAVVKVKTCGICGSDIPRLYRDGAHKMPLIPGHEFSGIVAALGKKTDRRLLHKRVGIYPLIPCGECSACQHKKYELCRKYSYLGSRRNGGFAEYVAVPAANLIELPDTVSFEAAAMLEPMAVAVHAMRRCMPCKEDRIAVCGLGTIGLLLVMFLKEAGFKNIFVIGSKDIQKKVILEMGISDECFLGNRKENVDHWLMERTKGAGADVFFECVGKNETIAQAIDLTTLSGKVCLMGNPFSEVKLSKDVYWKILRNQLVVTGTWNSSFSRDKDDDWHYALQRISNNRIFPERLITHRFSLQEFDEGFQIMWDKTEDYIKIMGVYE